MTKFIDTNPFYATFTEPMNSIPPIPTIAELPPSTVAIRVPILRSTGALVGGRPPDRAQCSLRQIFHWRTFRKRASVPDARP